MRAVAEVVGWLVILLFVLGSLGFGDFRLTFKPQEKHISIHDNTIINCQKPTVKNRDANLP